MTESDTPVCKDDTNMVSGDFLSCCRSMYAGMWLGGWDGEGADKGRIVHTTRNPFMGGT